MPRKATKTVIFSVRTTPEAYGRVQKLSEVLSRELGAPISQSQAWEMAVKECLDKRQPCASVMADEPCSPARS